MKAISFYHKETGLFDGTHLHVSDASMIALNTPKDHLPIEGVHDHLSKRIDLKTKAVIEYQPPQPSPDHEWNAETKRWQLTAAATDRANCRTAAITRIAVLESSQHRHVREYCLGIAGAVEKLKAIDDEIVLLESLISTEGNDG